METAALCTTSRNFQRRFSTASIFWLWSLTTIPIWASEWHQTHDYKGRYIGTDLHNPDFVQLAESFGAVGMRTEPQGFDASLQEALAANAPVVLEVLLPNLMPPFHPI